MFQGALLYVTEDRRDQSQMLRERFGDVELIDRLQRRRSGVFIEEYAVYRVENPMAPVLD